MLWAIIITSLITIAIFLPIAIWAARQEEKGRLILLEPLVTCTEKYRAVRFLGDEKQTKKYLLTLKSALAHDDSALEILLRQIECQPDGPIERATAGETRSLKLFGQIRELEINGKTVLVGFGLPIELKETTEIPEEFLEQAKLLGKNGYLILALTANQKFKGMVVLEPVVSERIIKLIRPTDQVKIVGRAEKIYAAWLYQKITNRPVNEIASQQTLDVEKSVKAWEAQALSAEVIAEVDLKTRYHLVRLFATREKCLLVSDDPEDKQLPLPN
ncbi:MAG TPA: hypothetical protein VMQ44_00935 [Candidatus Saccharimonadales bacterium]|nr:hypothetical protein [Candidatus Saccharimonadales bacterium]